MFSWPPHCLIRRYCVHSYMNIHVIVEYQGCNGFVPPRAVVCIPRGRSPREYIQLHEVDWAIRAKTNRWPLMDVGICHALIPHAGLLHNRHQVWIRSTNYRRHSRDSYLAQTWSKHSMSMPPVSAGRVTACCYSVVCFYVFPSDHQMP